MSQDVKASCLQRETTAGDGCATLRDGRLLTAPLLLSRPLLHLALLLCPSQQSPQLMFCCQSQFPVGNPTGDIGMV